MSGVETRYVGRNEGDQRLDRWFKTHFPSISFGRLQKYLRTGQIRVNGKRAKAGQRLEVGQSIRIPPLGDTPDHSPAKKAPRELTQEDVAFVRSLVIYQNDEVFVVNKPAGLAVQGGTKTERHLDGLLDGLIKDGEERPRLVHRLDRDTSGVMILAKGRESAAKLGKAFKGKETRKIYLALTIGVPNPQEGEISMALSKAGGPGQERVVADPEDGKSAITWYKVIDTAGKRAALVVLWPRTGRTHQLRAHLAALETPIIGDGKYGGKEAFLTGIDIAKQVHLHALEIDLPGTQTRVKAAMPDHFRQTLDALGLDPEVMDEDPFEEWQAPNARKKRGN